ncbi:MAG: VapC toxin family PIN domain ribonuclease [Deltaproteobacteria bacterium]|nr:PIN domain-containing protein [Candidatus Bipolaricaulota bacterium]RLB79173.1 MAG: VapC toxin family PIN domain ribonuclease [Deltaproteobacteria bacterium]
MRSGGETKYLLDTSAVLTLLEDEAGAERVEEIIKSENAIVPFLVLLEAYYISLQEVGEAVADRRYALLKQLPVKFIAEVSEPVLLTAARFKAQHHLSLADALIAAFAARNRAVLVHKDPEFEPLSPWVKQEPLPYK